MQDDLGYKKIEKASIYLPYGKKWVFKCLEKPHIMLVAQIV